LHKKNNPFNIPPFHQKNDFFYKKISFFLALKKILRYFDVPASSPYLTCGGLKKSNQESAL